MSWRVMFAVLLVTAVAAAAADSIVVIPPEGWVEDPAGAPGSSREEQWVFRPPGDTVNLFYISHARVADSGLATEYVAQRIRAAVAECQSPACTVIHNEQREDHRHAIADLELLRHGRSWRHHFDVRPIIGGLDVLFGSCVGNGAPFSACLGRLTSVRLPIAPSEAKVDTDSIMLRMIAYAFAAVALLGALFVGGIRLLRWRDMKRATALVDHELVTLSGVVEAIGTPITAPLSGKSCVLHRSHARLLHGNETAEPVEIETTAFAIVTPRGRVIVDEAPAIEVVPMTLVERSEAREAAFLARHGVSAGDYPLFDEVVIAPGDRVTVRGMVRVEQDAAAAGERGYRDELPTRIRLVASDKQPLTVLRAWR